MIRFRYQNQIWETRAKTWSWALLLWLMRHRPTREPPADTPPFTVVAVGTPMPGPYHPQFLPLVAATVEHTFGCGCAIPTELLAAPFYERDLPDDGDDVVARLAAADYAVSMYEATCADILGWLSEHGDVHELKGEP